MQICGCNKPDCSTCKQQAPFLMNNGIPNGKPIHDVDRNFLGTQPIDPSAEKFMLDRISSEHESANGFIRKSSRDYYLGGLPENEAKQAEQFYR